MVVAQNAPVLRIAAAFGTSVGLDWQPKVEVYECHGCVYIPETYRSYCLHMVIHLHLTQFAQVRKEIRVFRVSFDGFTRLLVYFKAAVVVHTIVLGLARMRHSWSCRGLLPDIGSPGTGPRRWCPSQFACGFGSS